MEIKWTEDQQRVIDLRNRNILVSAAAGSGKTAVLVERILQLLLDQANPMDVDQLLVVTFTRAAAAEMKDRIVRRINKELEVDPSNEHLRKQVSLMGQAHITTIDGFCKTVIENYFYRLDLEPGFRVADEAEIKLIQKDVLDEVLTNWYELSTDDFITYLSSYATGKDDGSIEEQILGLYTMAMAQPWPDEFLQHCEDEYKDGERANLDTLDVMVEEMDTLAYELENYKQQIKKSIELCDEEEELLKYKDNLEEDLNHINELLEHSNYIERYKLSYSYKVPRWASIRKAKNVDLKNYISNRRKIYKKFIDGLAKNYFYATPQEILSHREEASRLVHVLVQLTRDYGQQFRIQKKNRNIVDFNDLEHFALEILVDKKTKKPTSVAKEMQQDFREIMIDEYQDSNMVQEIILQAVSTCSIGKNNVFMVGDVKQSIYRFRLAKPELFMDKFHCYTLKDSAQQKILLQKNFRSRNEVLQFSNDLFSKLMLEDLGGVSYDKEAMLYLGSAYPKAIENCDQPEIIVVEEKDENGDKDTYSPEEKEAVEIVRLIKQQIEETQVVDKGTGLLRKASYRDIVILARSLVGWSDKIVEVLQHNGIPAHTVSRKGYFTAIEVQCLLDMLHIIDNKRQDIPLASVMRSPMGRFSEEQLAQIKIKGQAHSFCSCYEFALNQLNLFTKELGDKLKKFEELVMELREESTYLTIHELIKSILDKTGYLNYISALREGEARRMNIDMLINKAIAYEQTSYQGVFNFLRYMDRLQEYEVDFGAGNLMENAIDTVQIISIHQSKGLEFPIVIVGNMGKRFNRTSSRKSVLFHPEYGIGLDEVSITRRTKRTSIEKHAIMRRNQLDDLGEELRILYVALTRAKEKIILVGTMSKGEEMITDSLSQAAYASDYDYTSRIAGRSLLHWVVESSSFYPNKYRMEVHQPKMEEGQDEEREKLNQVTMFLEMADHVPNEIVLEIGQRFEKKYPYEEDLKLKPKMSVSEIKHHYMEQQFIPEEERPIFLQHKELEEPVPRFISDEEKENIGALRGSAMHRFLECIDYGEEQLGNLILEKKITIEEVKQQLQHIEKEGKISKQWSELVSCDKVQKFLNSELARRMVRAEREGNLYKEKPFVMGITPRDAGIDSDSEELILIQGIIDVFLIEADEAVLIDYKTDFVEHIEELKLRYDKQMMLYKEAIRRSVGRPVKEVIIYSFALQQELLID